MFTLGGLMSDVFSVFVLSLPHEADPLCFLIIIYIHFKAYNPIYVL